MFTIHSKSIQAGVVGMTLGLVIPACGVGLDTETEDLQTVTAALTDSVSATWMGTAGIVLSDGSSRMFVDPFVSRNDLWSVSLGYKLAIDYKRIHNWVDKIGGRADAVITGHSHYDHAMEAPFFAQYSSARLIGSTGTAMIAKGIGLPDKQISQVGIGDSTSVGAFKVRFYKGEHCKALFGTVPTPGDIAKILFSPSAASEYKLSGLFMTLFEHPNGNILHMSSQNYVPGMFKGIRADVVFFTPEGSDNDEKSLAEIAESTGARRVILIHWDDFFTSLDQPIRPYSGVDVEAIRAAGAKVGLEVDIVPVGQPTVVLPGGEPLAGE